MATLTFMRVVRHALCQGAMAVSLRHKETHCAVVRACRIQLGVVGSHARPLQVHQIPYILKGCKHCKAQLQCCPCDLMVCASLDFPSFQELRIVYRWPHRASDASARFGGEQKCSAGSQSGCWEKRSVL